MNYDKFLQEGRKRAAQIVAMRDQELTFATIGKRFDISAQRAQQIYKAATRLLREAAK